MANTIKFQYNKNYGFNLKPYNNHKGNITEYKKFKYKTADGKIRKFTHVLSGKLINLGLSKEFTESGYIFTQDPDADRNLKNHIVENKIPIQVEEFVDNDTKLLSELKRNNFDNLQNKEYKYYLEAYFRNNLDTFYCSKCFQYQIIMKNIKILGIEKEIYDGDEICRFQTEDRNYIRINNSYKIPGIVQAITTAEQKNKCKNICGWCLNNEEINNIWEKYGKREIKYK